MSILDEIKDSIIAMQSERAKELTQKALDEGLDADVILHKSLIPAMNKVGQEYEEGIKFIPEILIASKSHEGRTRFAQAHFGLLWQQIRGESRAWNGRGRCS